MPIHNEDIAIIFEEMADLLDIENANPFRVRAYRNAARSIRGLGHELEQMVADGTDLTKLRSRIGMVFQHFELYPHMSVRENLCLGQEKVLKRSRDEANAKAEALIAKMRQVLHG